MSTGAPRIAITIGLAAVAVGFVIAAFGDGPYLSLGGVNAGILLLAAGLFTALFAAPFAIERGLRDVEPDSDRRWEMALIRWAAIAAATIAVGLLLALAFGLHTSTLGGATAIVFIAEGVLVTGTLVAWMLSS